MKANVAGINHVALEVGNIEEALKFYSDFLNFEVQEKNDIQAFIYFGDQFLNFVKNDDRQADKMRHFGIAVDNKELVKLTLEKMGVKFLNSPFLDFLDPWGNRVEITTYSNIQYTKAEHVLRGMGLGHLKKTDEALAELNAKGLGPVKNN